MWCDFGHHYLLDSVHPTPLYPLMLPSISLDSPFRITPFSSEKLYSFVTYAIDRDYFHVTSASVSIAFQLQVRILTQPPLASSLPFGIGTRFTRLPFNLPTRDVPLHFSMDTAFCSAQRPVTDQCFIPLLDYPSVLTTQFRKRTESLTTVSSLLRVQDSNLRYSCGINWLMRPVS